MSKLKHGSVAVYILDSHEGIFDDGDIGVPDHGGFLQFLTSGPGNLFGHAEKDAEGFAITQAHETTSKPKPKPKYKVCAVDNQSRIVARISAYRFSCLRPESSPVFETFPKEMRIMADTHKGKGFTIMCISGMRVSTGNESENRMLLLMSVLGKLAIEKRWDIIFVAAHPNQLILYYSLGFMNVIDSSNVKHIDGHESSPAVLIQIDKVKLLSVFARSKIAAMSGDLKEIDTTISSATKFVFR